ncbi:unnamed protein product [Leptosia nina]|uniref:Uncharacterized protein n=1 Tax=Leptosia nina TaxID=320188 RepID=A0AAV1JQQ9_9NEOP
MQCPLADVQAACTTSITSKLTQLLNKHMYQAIFELRGLLPNALRKEHVKYKAGGAWAERAPNLGRPGKVTLERDCTGIYREGALGRSRKVAIYCYDCVDITFTGARTCSCRYESRTPERVYSTRRCRDCGARRSNDARGQSATVVYALVAHGPSGGATVCRPHNHSPLPLPGQYHYSTLRFKCLPSTNPKCSFL